MKKKLLVIYFLGLFGIFQAQNWCSQGAEWHYRALTTWPSINYQDGYIRVASTGTVVVLGQTCSSLSATFYGVRFSANSASVVVNNYFSLTTYENNQLIYAYNSSTNSFDTLVNFNATIGDKWLAYREGTQCTMPRSFIVVTDTGHVTINGQNLKTINNNSFIERIGSVGSMLPYNDCNVDYPYMGILACYKDNVFPLYQPPGYNLPCDFTTVGAAEYNLSDLHLNIYPNPGEGKFSVELGDRLAGESYVLAVLDVTGRKISEQKFSGTCEIDISGQSPGLYQVQLSVGGQILACKKLVNTGY